MDPRMVNGNNREANGFFLTTGREDARDPTSRGEHAVLRTAVQLVSDGLREHKIRSVNVLEHLEDLESMADDIEPKLLEVCKANGISESGIRAYTWLTILATISAYHEKIQRIRERETARDGEGRDGDRKGRGRREN